MKEPFIHPYIPNSDPEIQKEMLKDIGVSAIDDFFACIPDAQRYQGLLDLPKPYLSEVELKKHVHGIINKNSSTEELVSFLGGGCWQHHVPAICDEINSRSEFLTAYAGEPYEDHGRFQAMFEYASMMAELLDVDVVNIPTYDGSQAAATALRMACRITNRSRVIVVNTTAPDRLSVIKGYLYPDIEVVQIGHDPVTGLLDLAELDKIVDDSIGAVYFENPSYLGFIETQGQMISKVAHSAGALTIVYTDPSSLGILAPPSSYGADLTCGDIQPLGIHMFMGGGRGGFIGSCGDEKFIEEYPSRLFGIAPTTHGEWGFGDVAWERTSFANREDAKEFVGTAAALWGITAGVYLALMGPKGMRELGENCIKRANYAIKKMASIDNLKVPAIGKHFYKEFAVNFDHTGKKVSAINDRLLERGILGGHDLSSSYPQLGQSALYCFTEIHSLDTIDRLAVELASILKE